MESFRKRSAHIPRIVIEDCEPMSKYVCWTPAGNSSVDFFLLVVKSVLDTAMCQGLLATLGWESVLEKEFVGNF